MTMQTETIIALLLTFVISVVLYPIVIPLLHRLKFGQEVRGEGPQAHLKKQGTPTMGGIVFLFSMVVVLVFYVAQDLEILPVLIATVGFGVVGLLDDMTKIRRHHSEGLTPIQKLAGQLIISVILVCYFLFVMPDGTMMWIPFTNITVEIPWFIFVPFFILVMLATDNGVNLTDGLDGLSASVTAVVAAFFTVVALQKGSGIAPVTGALVGGLMAYLIFNVYPAKVFMGDTGSLAMGGFVAVSAFMLHMPFIIIVAGLIYVVEELSVALQVTYFKATKGKRLFKMAPIHHHFELCGFSETRIVAIFTIVTAVMCLIAYLGVR